jgi:hypothetical protein
MSDSTIKLTTSSGPGEYIDLGHDLSNRVRIDLTGEHTAKVIYFSAEDIPDGRPFRVGVSITEGDGTGEVVFGPVWPGRGLERFVQILGLTPDEVGSRLTREHVLGKHVRVRVEGDEREGVGGRTEKRWVIREFNTLT